MSCPLHLRRPSFPRTQHRLDEVDDLMRFVRPTASATFLILPGHAPDAPFAASLFGR